MLKQDEIFVAVTGEVNDESDLIAVQCGLDRCPDALLLAPNPELAPSRGAEAPRKSTRSFAGLGVGSRRRARPTANSAWVTRDSNALRASVAAIPNRGAGRGR